MTMPMNIKSSFNLPKLVDRQSLYGFSPWYVHYIFKRFYQGLSNVYEWDTEESDGAVFNLEFSPDGKLLAAAFEKLNVVLFDPISHKKAGNIKGAHTDCVNCIRFLDTRTFATCSDDCTISLWDCRKLNSRVGNLKGHSSWVKSIEYNEVTKQLISSAFDDTVRSWNINSYSGNGEITGNIVLRLHSLTRTKLSPDFSKMFLTTTASTIVVIYDLNVNRLHKDCRFLNPNNQNQIDFRNRTKRNRVEFINDFPPDSNPLCFSSLEVHPYGWCILSRFTGGQANLSSEWSVVHDIQNQHTGVCRSDCKHSNSRLTHFIEESNVAKGYIKEHCFSGDGRVICSPFGNGVRLLGFDSNCNELCKAVPDTSHELSEIKTLISHQFPVLTSRFSPTLPLLATGCMGGKVSFHQPRF